MSDLADTLMELGVQNPALVLAAERGLIAELACTMPKCLCPRGREYFETLGVTRGGTWWGPSPDRFPIPGRRGGTYTTDNVRLAHVQCNRNEGSSMLGEVGKTGKGGRARMASLGSEGRSALSHMAGTAAALKLTPQQRSDRARNGGRATGNKNIMALTPEHRRSISAKANCTQHQIRKSRPCICGQHNNTT